jgi:hypothetical protein
MPIPNNVIFSNHLSESRGVDFSEIRLIEDDDIKLLYLKRRLEDYLVNQINQISNKEKVNVPFPLTVMTCIAVETLGRVVQPISEFQKDEKKKKEIPS